MKTKLARIEVNATEVNIVLGCQTDQQARDLLEKLLAKLKTGSVALTLTDKEPA